MRTFRIHVLNVLLALGLLLASCATQGTAPGAGSSSGSTQPAAIAQGDYAYGTAGDTLNACLGRIPSGATAGQRMLAERSCQRDEEVRKPIQAVPGK